MDDYIVYTYPRFGDTVEEADDAFSLLSDISASDTPDRPSSPTTSSSVLEEYVSSTTQLELSENSSRLIEKAGDDVSRST